jgi:hypothetical protein
MMPGADRAPLSGEPDQDNFAHRGVEGVPQPSTAPGQTADEEHGGGGGGGGNSSTATTIPPAPSAPASGQQEQEEGVPPPAASVAWEDTVRELTSGDGEGGAGAQWELPCAEHDDGARLLGQRVYVRGHGPGLVLEFHKQSIGSSAHVILFDRPPGGGGGGGSGVKERVKLLRKDNSEEPWLIGVLCCVAAPSPNTPRASTLPGSLLPPPPPPLSLCISVRVRVQLRGCRAV